jgi:hypothetical protein
VWRSYVRIWFRFLFVVALATTIAALLGGDWFALLYFSEPWVVVVMVVGLLLLAISAARRLFRRT